MRKTTNTARNGGGRRAAPHRVGPDDPNAMAAVSHRTLGEGQAGKAAVRTAFKRLDGEGRISSELLTRSSRLIPVR